MSHPPAGRRRRTTDGRTPRRGGAAQERRRSARAAGADHAGSGAGALSFCRRRAAEPCHCALPRGRKARAGPKCAARKFAHLQLLQLEDRLLVLRHGACCRERVGAVVRQHTARCTSTGRACTMGGRHEVQAQEEPSSSGWGKCRRGAEGRGGAALTRAAAVVAGAASPPLFARAPGGARSMGWPRIEALLCLLPLYLRANERLRRKRQDDPCVGSCCAAKSGSLSDQSASNRQFCVQGRVCASSHLQQPLMSATAQIWAMYSNAPLQTITRTLLLGTGAYFCDCGRTGIRGERLCSAELACAPPALRTLCAHLRVDAAIWACAVVVRHETSRRNRHAFRPHYNYITKLVERKEEAAKIFAQPQGISASVSWPTLPYFDACSLRPDYDIHTFSPLSWRHCASVTHFHNGSGADTCPQTCACSKGRLTPLAGCLGCA
jgi:hypothetical protein